MSARTRRRAKIFNSHFALFLLVSGLFGGTWLYGDQGDHRISFGILTTSLCIISILSWSSYVLKVRSILMLPARDKMEFVAEAFMQSEIMELKEKLSVS